MSNIQNQKSGLAKLMATENLTVQHAKTQTASFDPKRRVLTVPIWEKTSSELYDLLVGHEVGHAIDTPRDGWHGVVHERGRNYKGFLNVVEDARIEKRQKRRYPGLRRSFVIGFNELMNRDFFGIKGRNINSLTFIDRLNIYTKSGYTLDQIQFSKKEQEFVERVQKLETWDDVLKLTNEIWDYSKDEQFELNMPQDYEFSEDGEEVEIDDSGESGEDQSEGEGKQKTKAKSGDEEGDEEAEGSSAPDQKSENEDDGDEDDKRDFINRKKESKSTSANQEPRCETDENYRANEATLIDKSAREYVYVTLPTPKLDRIITPAKRVQELLTEEFKNQVGDNYENYAAELYNTFRKKNERFIGLLAKEFEMRKAASKYSKAKTSETGDLDIGKIFKYQIDDNIFKRVMKVPKGKSHGLVLLLDKSGSMSSNLAASYEQILILATFCRKVSIPFTAYGFGNADGIRDIDFNNTSHLQAFSTGAGELDFSNVYLREMINSKMGNAEFTKAVKNLLCLADAWQIRGRGYYRTQGKYFTRPVSDGLSNTPLTEALVACQPILNEFRKNNNLDIVNLCVVHDGDADDTFHYKTQNGGRGYANQRFQNVVLTDKKSKIQIQLEGGEDAMRVAVGNWLSQTTGAKIIGFYLTPEDQSRSALRRRLHNKEVTQAMANKQSNTWYGDPVAEVITKYTKILKKDKFVESNNPGYESFFFIPGDDALTVDDDDFKTDSNTTAGLTRAFGKFTKSRQVNRVLVSRFIGMIAV